MDGLEDIPHSTPQSAPQVYIPLSEVGRTLPSRRVTRETIQDAYVQFILFCNPSFPQDADLAALKEVFSKPPSSNKKTFDTFEIFVNTRKFYDSEIKTWQQFALALGVEPVDTDEGTGTQRVQQYVVRLKRWMKLTHIDAFFHYMLDRPHHYYTSIPPLNDPHPSEGRDGVLLNEDLALRALDPRLRPKRGRKRHETPVDELPPAQRHTFRVGSADGGRQATYTPASAVTHSAYPQSAFTELPGHDPWSAVSPWPSQMGSALTDPRSAYSTFAVNPKVDSIRTPVISNKLHRWANNAAPPASGRRTASLSPSQNRKPTPPVRTPSNLSAGQVLTTLNTTVPAQKPAPEAPMSAVSAASSSSRKERQRLQLQVPQHTGGPVRLMTPPVPPPAAGQAEILGSEVTVEIVEQDATAVKPALESLRRYLAADLLRADLSGRSQRLTGSEAKRLAQALLARVGLVPARGNGVELVVTVAVQLGLAHRLSIPGMSFPPSPSTKRVHVTRYVIDDDGYEITVGEARASGQRVSRECRDVFDVEWTKVTGGLIGDFRVKGIDLPVHEQDGRSEMDGASSDREAEAGHEAG